MRRDDAYYMNKALREARTALAAGEFPVGCVLVAENEVVATGSRLNSDTVLNELDHAEIVALRNLQRLRPDMAPDRVIVYSTMEPCLMCFSTLVVNGVRKVVYGYEDAMGGGTGLPLHQLAPLYASLQIEVVPGILREQCLDLFQQFFKAGKNDYLKDSLLATYTLEQSVNVRRP